jgi:hypothetical protein
MARPAVVLVAAALVLAGCGDGSSSPSGETAGRLSFACPDPKADVEATPGESLPAGARAARICYSATMPVAWQPPPEPLVHGVARLVALVDRQRDYPHTDGCNADAGPAYRIVFDYPDGARMISGDTAGCRAVRLGSHDRLGGRAVWRGYFRLLATQRQHSRPGRVPDRRIHCPTRQDPAAFTPLWETGTLTRARFCLSSVDERGLTMTQRDLRILSHDAATSATRRQASPVRPNTCTRRLQFGYQVVGVDRWGDTVDLHAYCHVYQMVVPGTFRMVDVRELPETGAMFERLAATALH